jgi:hypothetical protein
MKKCGKCKQEKSLDEFYSNKSRTDGKSSWCKTCDLQKHKNSYEANPEAARQKTSEYRKNNLSSVVAANKEYRHNNKDKVAQWNQNRPLAVKLISGAKGRAKKRQIPFGLVPDDIFIPETCPILGIKLVVNKGKCDFNSPTLDCIIPHLGYVPGNVAVISFKANTMKSNASLEELKSLVTWLEKQQRN